MNLDILTQTWSRSQLSNSNFTDLYNTGVQLEYLLFVYVYLDRDASV